MKGFRQLCYLVSHALLFLERNEPVVVEELHEVTAQALLFIGVAPEVHGASVMPDHSDHLNREAGQAFEVTSAIPLVGEQSEEGRLGPGIEARIVGRPSGADFLSEEPQRLDKLFPAAFKVLEDLLQAPLSVL